MKQILYTFTLLLCCVAAPALAISPLVEYMPAPVVPHTEHFVKTQDNVRIKLWQLPAVAERRGITIILSGSDFGNMSYLSQDASILAQAGFDVFTYDYRGFGKSQQVRLNEEMMYYTEFVKDLQAVIAYARKAFPGNKLCLMGYAMGTLVNINAVINKEKVDYCIADAQIYDPQAVAERMTAKRKGTYLPKVRLPKDKTKYKEAYKHITVPLLIFQGRQDDICTVSDAENIKAAAPNVQLELYDGGHLQALYTLNIEYYEKIISFLEQQNKQ